MVYWSILKIRISHLHYNLHFFVLKIKELTPDRTGVARIARDAADNSYQIQAEAFQQVFGMTVEDFERAWKQFVLATY